jgi:tetratricopeptide (TPR) repeat protein
MFQASLFCLFLIFWVALTLFPFLKGFTGLFLAGCGLIWSFLTAHADFLDCSKLAVEPKFPMANRIIWTSLIALGVFMVSFHSVIAGFLLLGICVGLRILFLRPIICRALIKMNYFRLIELFQLSLEGDEDKYFNRSKEILQYTAKDDTSSPARFLLDQAGCAVFDPSWFGWLLRRKVYWNVRTEPLSLENLALHCQIEGLHSEALMYIQKAVAVAKAADEKERANKEHQSNKEVNRSPACNIHAQEFKYLLQIYIEQARYDDAEKLLNGPIPVSTYSSDAVMSVMRLTNLGKIRFLQHNSKEAEMFMKQAVIKAETPSDEKPLPFIAPQYFLRSTLDDLASLYEEQGQYADAESILNRALEITKALATPPESDSEADSTNGFNSYQRKNDANVMVRYLNRLAKVLRKQSKFTEAEACLNKAIEIAKKGDKYGHITLTTSLIQMARLKVEQDEIEDAEDYFKKARGYSEVSLRESDQLQLYLIGRLIELADFYKDQGKFFEAEALLKRTLEIAETVGGLRHPIVAMTLDKLAALPQCHPGALTTRSILIMLKALEISRKAFPKNHPNILAIEALDTSQTKAFDKISPRAVEPSTS